MRILLSCMQSLKRHAIPAYSFWENYFKRGIEEAGHQWVEVPGVDWAEGLVYSPGDQLDAWRARTWETVMDFIRREHARQPVHCFLGYLYPKHVEVSAIADLQRMGIPCVNFFCDNVREFRRVPVEYHTFDLHWVPEYSALPMYRAAGLPHLHAPMPCWVPTELRRVPLADTEPPTFIGSADILRRDLLGRALAAGADFIVRGPAWTDESSQSGAVPAPPRSLGHILTNQMALVRDHGLRGLYHKMETRLRPLHPPTVPATRIRPAIFGSEYLRITREAAVTIGVNRVPTARHSNHQPVTYSRLRDIEAPMLGACYLTEWTEGLSQLFDLGEEVESYRTPEELAEKIKRLVRDTPKRLQMRERGQRRALQDHSIARSLHRIAASLGLDYNKTDSQ